MKNSAKYNELLIERLASYKLTRLGIEEDGTWKKNRKYYPHILPEPLCKLNLIETFRKEFWGYYESHRKNIKLHQNFNHLNSSQAMAFNLFYPFIYNNMLFLPILLDCLMLHNRDVDKVEFEKIECKEEGTNFDFFIKYKSGSKIFFELKLSEIEFGKAKNDEGHLIKYNNIYKGAFRDIIVDEFKDPQLFFENYQIIRNLIYLGRSENSRCIFIFPEENDNLKSENIRKIVSPIYRHRVDIRYLEKLIDDILYRLIERNHSRLITHFELFKEKYIVAA